MGSVEEISEAVGHAFWDTQPVPSLNAEEEDACGPINPADPEKVRAEPYNLPPAFEWTDLDLSDAEQAKELYTLLHENYVEDGDAMFRFDYSLDFIRWAMQPPGALDYWHVGVRVSQTKKLVAFIGATPADLLCHGQRVEPRPPPAADKAEEGEGGAGASGVNIEEKLSGLDLDGGATGSAASSGGGAAELGDQAVVEVNFLCVHKKLRSKRLAPVTDMFSFYSLPSSVLKHEKHTKLHAAYCYYYFANKTPALVLAKRHEFDVFNALDILDNDSLLKELKFGIGDGHLQYYLYNWRCPTVVANEIGLVLL
ncbi:hypothetical protein EMIHUDRAFT_450767 [Emiliania huxleyi CCMP1516]|uniref:Glycylpeptide N-tetradecanoyltransferase n=2 Tax=Emiliania huxleyi TaxID=2903 RepID=A0A0D3JFQ0_EMIH1|nr:hypothetical protein EMIHUDRAFT_450767 [Emiliania huxleyi CCMP1516]EOD22335.1 hypothetical protein EMIHUDRAFT_450767 [Emiliania huxleyi CCMP1516]|eukprot:XP_005774764.1 hypothetical protein EMIHUDRAFT_450767 [Emiliania huxleyi CCMP1516]